MLIFLKLITMFGLIQSKMKNEVYKKDISLFATILGKTSIVNDGAAIAALF